MRSTKAKNSDVVSNRQYAATKDAQPGLYIATAKVMTATPCLGRGCLSDFSRRSREVMAVGRVSNGFLGRAHMPQVVSAGNGLPSLQSSSERTLLSLGWRPEAGKSTGNMVGSGPLWKSSGAIANVLVTGLLSEASISAAVMVLAHLSSETPSSTAFSLTPPAEPRAPVRSILAVGNRSRKAESEKRNRAIGVEKNRREA